MGQLRILLLTALALAASAVLTASSAADLTPVNHWGSAGTGNGQFQVPQGVAVDAAGNVYVADQNNNRIEKFDSNGNFLLTWGGPGQLNGPGHLGLDPQGNVLVADEGNYRALKYSPTGTLIQQYGRFGTNPGQFRGNPRGVAADPTGNIYVLDSGGGGTMDVFSPSGAFLTSWGAAGTGPGQWNVPRGVTIDATGRVYVGDQNNQRIDVFNQDGTFVRTFGTAAPGPDQLGGPNQVAVDSRGNAFVADTAPGAIVQFAADGSFVARRSDAGTDPIRPYGIAVGPNDEVFATDVLKSRVVRFRQRLPAPTIGVSANAQPVTGVVKVQVPGSNQFVELSKAGRQVPIGSKFDTTRGTVAIDVAKNRSGATQRGTFSTGVFSVSQSQRNALTTLTAIGGNLSSCRTKVPSGGAPKVSTARSGRQLFANVKGRFRTRGRNSAATVRGTQWVQKDTCAGTLTIVKRGTVVVRDFAKRRNITLRKGQRYLARAVRR